MTHRSVSQRRTASPPAAIDTPRGSAQRPATYRYAEWAIVAVALVSRLVLVAQLGDHPVLRPEGGLDDGVYAALARRVAAGDLALGPDVYFLSPFYTYFLGLIFALTGNSIVAARVVQAALGAGAVWLIARCAERWFGARAAWVAGALAAVTGIVAFNEILILQSSVDPILTALALYLLTRALAHGRVTGFGAAGAAFGLLTLNRPTVLACAVASVAVWMALKRSRQAARQAAALCVGVLLIIAPVAVRNRLVAGEWVALTSHGGLNFYIGNGEGADGTWHPVPGVSASIEGQRQDVRRIAGEALHRDVSASEASDYFYARAWTWMKEHPAEWLQLSLRKLALTFNAADPALNYSYTYFRLDEPTILKGLVVGPWLIVPFGLFGLVAGLWLVSARRFEYVAWAAFVPAYVVTLVAFFVSSRYRLPLLVALLVASGGAVDWFWRNVAHRRWRSVAGAGLVVAFLAALVTYPIRVNDGRVNEREDYAVRLIADGRVDEAERLVADTERLDPNPAVLFRRVGLVFRERGDLPRAARYLARAAAVDGEDAAIRLDLGRTLLEAGRAAEALPHLQAAIEAGEAPYTAVYAFLQALAGAGRVDDARMRLSRMAIPPDMTTAGLLEFARLAMDLEDAGTAERFLAVVIGREPSNGDARDLLGVALAVQGKGEAALEQLQAAVRIDPANALARYHLALSFVQAGRIGEARRELEQVLRLKPGDADAVALLRELPQERLPR